MKNLFGSSPRRSALKSSSSTSTIDSDESPAHPDGLCVEIADGSTAQESVAMPQSLENSTGGDQSASSKSSTGSNEAIIITSVEDATSLRQKAFECRSLIIISEPLYYMSHYMHRSAKESIADVVCRFYSPEEISDAKSKICLFEKHLQVKLKTRRNGKGKLKIEAEVADILNALYELDKKEIKTRFLSENMARIPPCNPSEVDPYSNMLCITDLQTENKSVKENLGAVKAHAISNSDKISELNEAIQEIKSLLAMNAATEINKIIGLTSPNRSLHHSSSNPGVGVKASAESTPAVTSPSYAEKVVASPAKQLSRPAPAEEECRVSTPATAAHSATPAGDLGATPPPRQTLPPPPQPPTPTPAAEPSDVTDDVTGDAPAGVEGGASDDGGAWISVNSKRRALKGGSSPLVHRRTNKTSFLGAPARRDFYLFNIDSATDNSVIEQFLKSNDINQCWLRQVSNELSLNKSFRLTVLESDGDKIHSISWPDRVYLKKWRFKSSNGFKGSDRRKKSGQGPDSGKNNQNSNP